MAGMAVGLNLRKFSSRGSTTITPTALTLVWFCFSNNTTVQTVVVTGCNQAASKLGICAEPGGPNPTDLRFAAKSLARSHQSDLALVDSESCKDVLRRGLMRVTMMTFSKLLLQSRPSRKTSCIHVILTAWEIEGAERHVELLRLLQCTNMDVYKEADDEASWFEKLLSDQSLPEVQDDLNLNLMSYRNDLASLAKMNHSISSRTTRRIATSFNLKNLQET
ncbi:hypothetical protein BDR06DRAFT_998534 [Suillus hirtellus]|nr:hypothetical protein BDR06DRAFT_998534 [Suillus hirtellus]